MKRLFLVIVLVGLLGACYAQQKTYIEANVAAQQRQLKTIPKDRYVAKAGHLGIWQFGDDDLPVFNFTGQLPCKSWNKEGEPVADPQDPWFILGNYRLTSFIHASGEYELFCMERAIARLNYHSEEQKYKSFAAIETDGVSQVLTGLGSGIATDTKTIKNFGTGYAEFICNLPSGLTVRRILSTPPSRTPTDGAPAILIKVQLTNTTRKAIEFAYTEGLQVKYDMRFWHNWPFIDPLVCYPVKTQMADEQQMAMVSFVPQEEVPLVTGDSLDFRRADAAPPAVCMQLFPAKNMGGDLKTEPIDKTATNLTGRITGKIQPRSTQTFHILVGTNQHKTFEKWQSTTKALQAGIADDNSIPFRDEWQKRLPGFEDAPNRELQIEMIWHTYVLYSMANWNEFYQEVFIPQGNIYEYDLGVSACMNDWMDHCLPVIHFDTELAKSILRFGLRHTDFEGAVKASDEGAGLYPKSPWQKSHSQLYILWAMAEYLNVTGDGDFLTEEVPFFGCSLQGTGTVLDRIERLFVYIRDVIYVGQHGMPRALLSDNNDCLYFFYHMSKPTIRYHNYFASAESFSNTAMAIVYLEQLAEGLQKVKNDPALKDQQERINQLVLAIEDYRSRQLENIQKNWGSKAWTPRLLVGNHVFGQDTIFNETQCYVIGIKDLPKEKRQKLWQAVWEESGNGETIACRYTSEPLHISPPGEDPTAKLGEHELGGIWYYTNAPLIVNYSDIDLAASQEAFQRMTLLQHAKDYPNYWVGMWSAPDALNSSISPDEGTTSTYTRPFPVYCAHPHAWLLWMYYHLYDKP